MDRDIAAAISILQSLFCVGVGDGWGYRSSILHNCNINIAVVISPPVPNHPHTATLKIFLTVTAMMWRDDDVAATSIRAQPALDSPHKLKTQLHKATSYPFEMDV